MPITARIVHMGFPFPKLRVQYYTERSAYMNVPGTKPRLSQESITILSVGGALLGTAVALGVLILTTTERIEHRIERVEDRLLAVEKETASLRVDIAELRASLERRQTTAIGIVSQPPTS